MCDWSPTGEWIVFASDRGGDFEVWLDPARRHRPAQARRRRRPEQPSPLLPRRPLDRFHQQSRRVLGRGDQPSPPAPALRRPLRGPARRHGPDPADPQRLRGGHARLGARRRFQGVSRENSREARGLLIRRQVGNGRGPREESVELATLLGLGAAAELADQAGGGRGRLSRRALSCVSFRPYPPRSPGENFTFPGLISVCVSLIREDSFRTMRVNSVSCSRPSGPTQT